MQATIHCPRFKKLSRPSERGTRSSSNDVARVRTVEHVALAYIHGCYLLKAQRAWLHEQNDAWAVKNLRLACAMVELEYSSWLSPRLSQIVQD
eukprot:scaffold161433_cov18-Tisochrysis_lutea.AAC.1